jgi:formate dehydrogenase subunit beta
MDKAIKLTVSLEDGIKKLLNFLLEKRRIHGAVVLRQMDGSDAVAYSLVTDPEVLAETSPLFPLMPTNAASVLSRFTLKEALSEPIAVVLRPCELRAFIELVKRGQGSLQNFIFISSICGGVYPLQQSLVEGGVGKRLPDYWKAMGEAEIPSDIRPTCRTCEWFVPIGADMTVVAMGRDDLETHCTICLQTERAVKLIQGAAGTVQEEKLETDTIQRHRKSRNEQKRKFSEEMKLEEYGLSGMIELFGKCIGCHGCRAVCPICYCDLCVFESRDFEPKPVDFERGLKRKSGLRVPPDTLLYHLGRMNHMAVSCVGCGSCSDVCPVDIPVSSIFTQVGESVQQLFEYVPGEDPEEEIPITKFEMEEFAEFEN